MKRLLFLILATLGVFNFAKAEVVRSGMNMKLIIPLYRYPTCTNEHCIWKGLEEAVKHVDVAVILNPSTGPEKEGISTDYKNAIAYLREIGVKQILGYTHTSWTNRDINDVLEDIRIYNEQYGIDGLFIDETSVSADAYNNYYKTIIKYVRNNTSFDFEILNFGEEPDSVFFTDSEYPITNAMIYEKTDDQWDLLVETREPPAWITQSHSDKFSCIVFNAGLGFWYAKNALDEMVRRNCGYVYVTDDYYPNPFDTKPMYWAQEIQHIKEINVRNHKKCIYNPDTKSLDCGF